MVRITKKREEKKALRRTDIAVESLTINRGEKALAEKVNGVLVDTKKYDSITLTRLSVRDEEGEKTVGKPIGEYITIDVPDIKYNTESYEKTCEMIAEEIKRMYSFNDDNVVLVVGLGNRDITPDALGCEVVSKTIITNHMKKHAPELLGSGMRAVCAIAPGVLGTTGMESLEITKGVSEKLEPDLIIVIDALAAADFSRISTTFQLSDAGISPGSGVGNNRDAFTKEALGTKVIAIGVPTVVDARSICDCEKEGEPMMVTPRDIDLVIERCSKTVANGINLALHESLTLKDIEEYVG